MAGQLNQLPSSLEPISSFSDKEVPTYIKPVWYKFLLSVSGLLSNLVGGVLGFTVDSTVASAGATQGTATQLTTEWSVVTSGPANGGVIMQNFGPGAPSTVFNKSGSTIKVYPPSGGAIDILAPNAPYSLNNGKVQTFSQVDVAQWLSLQLQVP